MDPSKQPIVDVLSTFSKKIADSVTTIEGTKEPSGSLITDYNTLKKDIDAAVSAATTTDLAALTTKQTELTARLDALDNQKTIFMSTAKPKVYAFSDLLAQTTTKTLEMTLFFIFLFAIFLGGTIMSHVFLDTTLTHRIFYFLYGAALFPLSLAYGIFDPPYWRSGLFPWFLRGKEASAFSVPPLSWIWWLVSYSAPNPMDKETMGYTRFLLRVLSAGALFAFIGFYYVVNGRLPI